MKTKSRILVVCFGNACRSKMFEALLIHELAEQSITDVSVESAGLMRGCDMLTVTYQTQMALQEVGLAVVDTRSRHIGEVDDNIPFNAVFCMDEGQKETLVQSCGFSSTIVHVLNEANGGVFDPTLDVGGPDRHCDCRDLLTRCAKMVASNLDQYLPNRASRVCAPANPTLPT